MKNDPAPDDERSPLFGSWPGFYLAVTAFLIVQVLVYWLITLSFT